MRNTFRLVFFLYKLTFEFFACFNNICLASHAEYVSPGILFCISSLLNFFACFNTICLASHAEYVSPGVLFCISSLLNFLLALMISVWQVMRNTFRLVFYFV